MHSVNQTTASANKMKTIKAVNDFVIRFANVNGTGSASANNMFAKAIFRMGIPVSPKNIFPSNIQGLPTWYDVRISEKGYLGRRGGVDIIVAMNPQSLKQDIDSLESGGYLIYDSTKPLDLRIQRDDINYIRLPLTSMCRRTYKDSRQRQLFKNVIYIGALSALLNIEFSVLTGLVRDQFKGKDKLIAPNIHALEMGYQYADKNYQCPLDIRVETRDLVGDKILMEGNTALGLGAVYGGATVTGWYPITPSTSVIEAFETYCKRLRIDPGSGDKKFAIIQAEDELAAIGIAIGASWNGARAFTATSGPGLSLMSEFLGLAYFAEVPLVLFDVQRAGPSTGMPTRTQQSDILSAAYASHGDTKHVMLLPANPKECFDMSAKSFDLAEHLQTPILVMSDLDLGMNDNMSDPLKWDDSQIYDRGKVLSEDDLENAKKPIGRYRDIDDDGVCYRTYPGTHPTKGAYFTRGTSRDEDAIYTECPKAYIRNMERLMKKWNTAKRYVPAPEFYNDTGCGKSQNKTGIIFYGTSTDATLEARDMLAKENIELDLMRIRSFPFNNEVEKFIANHHQVFVVDQNRDGQMRTLLVNECDINPAKLPSIIHYNGMPVSAQDIAIQVRAKIKPSNVTKIKATKKATATGEQP